MYSRCIFLRYLYLRVDELRQLVSTIEREERDHRQKYVTSLREGELALNEKTAQLARTRNDLKSQMTKLREINTEITKSRTELRELQLKIATGNEELNQLSEKKQEEIRNQSLKMQVCSIVDVYLPI